jgi:lysophospholipase L1-like esterase
MQEKRVTTWSYWRHSFLKRIAAPLLIAVLALPLAAQASDVEQWVGTWATAPFAQTNPLQVPDFADATFRQIVHVSLGGKALRVRFTNEFGTEPLKIGAVHVALSAGNGAIKPDTDRAVTFGGKPSITIPVGSIAISDPVALPIPAFADVAISTYIPAQQISSPSFHNGANQTNYLQKGNEVGAPAFNSPTMVNSWYFLRGVDVEPKADNARAIVAFGDSITDGAQASLDQNRRWPDVLAQRLQANAKTANVAVLNAGIGGNRVLHDGTAPSALARFDHDVLAQAGVKYVIVLESINDIGRLARNNDPIDNVTADDLKQGLQQLVARAHEHKLKVFGGTILPYKGAKYYSEKGEAIRQEVNRWIRTSGVFDGVVDFEKATQDPTNPQAILPAYDCRDHLHPNDVGYKAMGDAIDLSLFQ